MSVEATTTFPPQKEKQLTCEWTGSYLSKFSLLGSNASSLDQTFSPLISKYLYKAIPLLYVVIQPLL